MSLFLNDLLQHLNLFRFNRIGLAIILLLIWGNGNAFGQNSIKSSSDHLKGTKLLTTNDVNNLRSNMLKEIKEYLSEELKASSEKREYYWNRDYQSYEKYLESITSNRKRLKKITGVAEKRQHVKAFTLDKTTAQKSVVAKADNYTIYSVRWPVFKDVSGVGLWIEPNHKVKAQVVAIPDADWTPEMLMGLTDGIPAKARFAEKLAAAGCRVIIPVLIDRDNTWSGYPGIQMNNETHREFIYRRAYEVGRHIIGYEIQKVLGAIDWFTQQNYTNSTDLPIAVAGYGEGGLIALYSAAIDQRIDGTLVSGYFQEREGIWKEPIYRNVWGLLSEFGDAEIASLIAPRSLVIEASQGPEVDSPTKAGVSAVSNRLQTPSLASVKTEYRKTKKIYQKLGAPNNVKLVVRNHGTGFPGANVALKQFLNGIGVNTKITSPQKGELQDRRLDFSPADRMRDQFMQLLLHLNQVIENSESERKKFFWDKIDTSSTLQKYVKSIKQYREHFWKEILGKMPAPSKPFNARSRLVYKTSKYRAYWIKLDVSSHIIAGGILLIPNGLQPGEKRPLVVCKHGLGGRPEEVTNPKIKSVYHSFGSKLADKGYVVYAPQSIYGLMPQETYANYSFRIIDRMAEPLKKTVYSVMLSQQRQALDWLKKLPFVDKNNIGVYGLSYGGKSAMRMAPILQDYSVVICVGDFDEWVWKTTTLDSKSYLYSPEYDMYAFNFANTTNYAEMAAMIAPRPFMVVRGHRDEVSNDSQVAYEYAKVRKLYDRLGIGDRTTIEFFNGPHEIHGVGAFQFLDKYLK